MTVENTSIFWYDSSEQHFNHRRYQSLLEQLEPKSLFVLPPILPSIAMNHHVSYVILSPGVACSKSAVAFDCIAFNFIELPVDFCCFQAFYN